MSRPQWWQYNSKARRVYLAVLVAGNAGITHGDLLGYCGMVGREVSNMLGMLKDGGFVCYRGGRFWTVDSTCKPMPAADPEATDAPASAPAPTPEPVRSTATSPQAMPVVRAAPTSSFDLTADGRFAITWAGGCVTLPVNVTRDMFCHLDRLGGLALQDALDEHLGDRP